MNAADRFVLDALRSEVKRLLSECTEAQQAFFLKVFPGGVDAQPEEKLRTALGLCERTIAKNMARATVSAA